MAGTRPTRPVADEVYTRYYCSAPRLSGRMVGIIEELCKLHVSNPDYLGSVGKQSCGQSQIALNKSHLNHARKVLGGFLEA